MDSEDSCHTIVKDDNTTTIRIKSIKYKVSEDDEDGKTLDKQGDSFSLFEKVEDYEKQKYYLSQCYSKNYPLTVNVIFEQLQN